ncbi:hypothetical protein [uncultured Gimesia sp.]|jgi:hypothetical protein|uniref:hypothetical protein n=1 Tax=uncultured Gimesia sp. TaxID=1678688 RepID=UPI0026397314|nr:hypothetical protein [uncultured Gimesia sp.]
MRSSVYSLMFVSQLFLATAYGQEQTPLEIHSDNTGFVSGKNSVNITRMPPSNSGPVYQRMSVSQKLIQQRAFLQAKERLNRINARKAMGITPGRPTVNINVSPIPSYAQIMQQSAGFYFDPYHFYGYWYGPNGYELGQ